MSMALTSVNTSTSMADQRRRAEVDRVPRSQLLASGRVSVFGWSGNHHEFAYKIRENTQERFGT